MWGIFIRRWTTDIIGCRNKRGITEILYEGSVYCDNPKVAQLFGDYFSFFPLLLRNNIPLADLSYDTKVIYLSNCSHDTMGFDLSNSDK